MIESSRNLNTTAQLAPDDDAADDIPDWQLHRFRSEEAYNQHLQRQKADEARLAADPGADDISDEELKTGRRKPAETQNEAPVQKTEPVAPKADVEATADLPDQKKAIIQRSRKAFDDYDREYQKIVREAKQAGRKLSVDEIKGRVRDVNMYDFLGLPRGADAQQVREAFRVLSRVYHPDLLGGNDEMQREFQTIMEYKKALLNELGSK